jgi:hypothetical protein
MLCISGIVRPARCNHHRRDQAVDPGQRVQERLKPLTRGLIKQGKAASGMVELAR